MSQPLLNSTLATRRAASLRSYPSARRSPAQSRKDLEVKLSSLQRDYAELHTAIFEAAQVHRRLCAPRLVRYGEFEIASEIFAVRYLPGDFFTVEERGDSVIMALGDICGKGLAAGMWTTHLVGLVGAQTAVTTSPKAIIAGVNRDLCQMSPAAPLVSLFLAKLDPATGEIDYCSAGHPPAFLLRADGRLETLGEGGLLLGVHAAAPYACGSVKLAAGDLLVTYSDGIVESLNQASEEFGYQRLESHLRLARNESADNILFSVLGAVQDFSAACPPVDDMSLAVVSRLAH